MFRTESVQFSSAVVFLRDFFPANNALSVSPSAVIQTGEAFRTGSLVLADLDPESSVKINTDAFLRSFFQCLEDVGERFDGDLFGFH